MHGNPPKTLHCYVGEESMHAWPAAPIFVLLTWIWLAARCVTICLTLLPWYGDRPTGPLRASDPRPSERGCFSCLTSAGQSPRNVQIPSPVPADSDLDFSLHSTT